MKHRRVGAALRACRERSGMTQQELADVLMKDVTYISKVENSRMVPDALIYEDWISVTNGRLLMFVYNNDEDSLQLQTT